MPSLMLTESPRANLSMWIYYTLGPLAVTAHVPITMGGPRWRPP